MIEKLHNALLFIVSGIILLLALLFFNRATPVQADVPLLTKQMVEEHQTEQQQAVQKQKQAEAARKHADLMARLEACTTDDECIMVDKDPCGCLKGPDSVTAINSNYSLEFSRMMEKRFAQATACPSVGSTERECSGSARAACVERHCKIVY